MEIGILSILHDSIMGQSETLINIDMSTTWWEEFGGIVIGILAGLAAIALVVLTCGIAAIIGATITLTVGSVALIATGAVATGVIVGTYYSNEFLPDDLSLPMYTISAEEIFKGDIALFDIDFFNPKEVYVKIKDPNGGNKILNDKGIKWVIDKIEEGNTSMSVANEKEIVKQALNVPEYYFEYDESVNHKKTELEDGTYSQLSRIGYTYSYYYLNDDGEEVITSKQDTADELKNIISKWYNALRNIAIVIMMSILLYIGIRMMLSSLAADKAKYKQMLIDWLVGMCLLFFMHYIMAFSTTIVQQFTKTIKSTYDTDNYAITIQADEDGKMAEALKEGKRTDVFYPEGVTDPDDVEYIVWPTNLMGRMRIETQMHTGKSSFIGYAICFVVLVFYTVFFAFTYLKRVVYMAFLTMISPMVAMTYPIDKLNDGQAQAFNKWLKEYIFNLLIQPLHLLLYTVLVSSAFDFAGKNIWYMLVAIGFLVPAEKLLRSFFGFEKATTPGSLAGAAVGAGLISRGMGSLLHKIPGRSKDKEGKGKNIGAGSGEEKSPRMQFKDDDFDATAHMLGESGKEEDKKDSSKNGDEEALKRYRAEGFGQNANGEYFNPYTSEYDSKYDPRKDSSYAARKLDNASSPQGNKLNNNEKTESKRKPGKMKRLRRAAGVGLKKTFTGNNLRKMGRRAGRRLANVGKGTIRMAGGVAGATFAGTIGVAAGIASGDPSNALQYGLAGAGAGAMAGAKVTGGAINAASDALRNSNQGEIMTAMKEAYYGEDEYRQKQLEKQLKQWKKDSDKREKLQKIVGTEAADEMYSSGEIDEYLKHNIDNIEDMATIHELQKNEEMIKSREEAIAVHKYAKVAGDTTSMKAKDRKEWAATYKERFMEAGLSEDRADEESKKTLKKLDAYNNIKFKL